MVKRVYLFLITLDSIGGTIGISPFLDTFLQERLNQGDFAHLEIRPLFCSDIAALEGISGCFAALSLPEILEQWFTENSSLTAPLTMTHIPDSQWRGNEWLHQEDWNEDASAIQIAAAVRTIDRKAPKGSSSLLRSRGTGGWRQSMGPSRNPISTLSTSPECSNQNPIRHTLADQLFVGNMSKN